MSARRPAKRAGSKSAVDLRRLLNRLADGARLIEDREGAFHLENAGVAKPVDRTLVAACRAADLLERADRGLVLSDAGRARVRRCEAVGDDRFRAQHQRRSQGVQEIDGVKQAVLLNDGESPLGWLRSRKDRFGRPLIGQEQFEAGERLRADYWFAQMSPRVTANWSAAAPMSRSRRGAPTDTASLQDGVLAAKDRVAGALCAVGSEVSGILVDICCELKGLEDAEKENGWPQRAGKVVLQIALTRLAKHYGLIVEGDEGRRKLR
ncbi:MAG: DUF6456 domain-containing protein [Methyloceanibacter sp.]|nr:DUF6456 domain-containing protein [Methyloceanibacter sp.]